MTKKHFIALAKTIKVQMDKANSEYFTPGYRTGLRHAAEDMADMLSDVCSDCNPRFDRDKFLKACGVE